MDEQPEKRYRNSIDTVSLNEADETAPSAEEVAAGDLEFANILKNLPTDRQRFIALSLFSGYNVEEIAFILNTHQSNIVHIRKAMKIRLAHFRVRYGRKS